jgi:hypothetical protein
LIEFQKKNLFSESTKIQQKQKKTGQNIQNWTEKHENPV